LRICSERLSHHTKKVEKRKQKAKKECKRAMIAAWSDSDSSDASRKRNKQQTFASW